MGRLPLGVTAMPSFRFLIYGTGRACRDTPPGMSDDEILAALRQIGKRRDRLMIFVGNGESGTATVTEYLTSACDQPLCLERDPRGARVLSSVGARRMCAGT